MKILSVKKSYLKHLILSEYWRVQKHGERFKCPLCKRKPLKNESIYVCGVCHKEICEDCKIPCDCEYCRQCLGKCKEDICDKCLDTSVCRKCYTPLCFKCGKNHRCNRGRDLGYGDADALDLYDYNKLEDVPARYREYDDYYDDYIDPYRSGSISDRVLDYYYSKYFDFYSKYRKSKEKRNKHESDAPMNYKLWNN